MKYLKITAPLILLLLIFGCKKDDGGGGEIIIDSAILGCNDPEALNYDADATFDDGSCEYPSVACSECDFIIPSDQYAIDNNNLKLPPGSVICLGAGTRKALFAENFNGTADNPFIFTNCDGLANVTSTTTAGMRFYNSTHFKITGTGDAGNYYGIAITAKDFAIVVEKRSSDFEIDHIEVLSAGNTGITARTDPTCDGSTNRSNFTQFNTIIHNNKITNTSNEGLYIGGSHWNSGTTPANCGTKQFEPELHGVRIYNNILENIGKDGIQVGSAIQDCQIFGNSVFNYGTRNDKSHQAGIMINPGTTGMVYNNMVEQGSGRGAFLQGFDLSFFNNIIYNCGSDGIVTTDRAPQAGTGFYIYNNTLVNLGDNGLKMISGETRGNIMYNNVVVNFPGKLMLINTNNVEIDVQNNFETQNIDEVGFKNIGIKDFSLVESSPLIDMGLDVSDRNLNWDFYFEERPKDDYDIGAHEF